MMQAATATAACEVPTGAVVILVVLTVIASAMFIFMVVTEFKDYVKAIANDEIRKELEICPQCKQCRS